MKKIFMKKSEKGKIIFIGTQSDEFITTRTGEFAWAEANDDDVDGAMERILKAKVKGTFVPTPEGYTITLDKTKGIEIVGS